MPSWWGSTVAFLYFLEGIQEVVIFSSYRVSYVMVFVVLFVFYRQFGANVDSFQLNFVFNFIPSLDASCLSSSVELSKSSCRYLVDFHFWFGLLALDLLVHGGV